MADTNPAGKHPQAATVEDCADSDDEKGDSSASKPASNSASKRSRKTSNTRRSSPSKVRSASDTGQPEPPLPPKVKDAPSRQTEEPATQAGAKDEPMYSGVPPPRSGMPPPPHSSMYAPSGVSMPPSLPGLGGPQSPVKVPTRPAIHHPERTKASSSLPKFSSKISTYDTFSAPFSPDDDEHFSARNLPIKPQRVPGGFDSDTYSSESPPDSPEYYEQPRRPPPFQRATTSAVQQIHRSGHSRSRSDYPAESAYGYRRAYPPEATWDQYSHAEYPEYEDQGSYPGGRRGSSATTWTQHTSASDPPHPTYVQYDHHGRRSGYPNQEHAAIDYMDQARGHPEERITAETLRQLPSGPRSTRSNHSHRRSQHSMSETSSRHRGAEGSVKLIMPIAAAEDTKIQLSGDMGDREVSFRSINDPGMVEVTIGTIAGGERRYLKSASQTSRAPTRSSGSTRHAARGGAEGQEQGREYREHREHREHRHLSRAPSSRKS
ncbi:unnamed protein product [Aureobasidium uvarum]|uniref:Uncharacterized protein n=1 Tax=Aureobasidium uvarum TaxID=2773716 RepID=A0A9N8KI71_9PEZI|nr:unnamed protein product [Aureobasidium uvarum]